MEKIFKYLCIVMSVIILFSSFGLVFAAHSSQDFSIDFLNCKEIVNNIENYELNMTSIVYAQNSDGDWEEYYRIHGTENRIWVDIENIPQKLIDAFISIEDERFYSHSGVDWKRTTAAFVNYLPFVNIYSTNQGGSTITQQLIKNITSDNSKSAVRKAREIARSMLIEKITDKTTILEAYLNTISLGNGICGVQVAANYYFNKNVDELTLAECASLAAITKNPSAYNPEDKPEGNKKRRNDVLYKMYDSDKINAKELVEALETEIAVDTTKKKDFELPVNDYFIDTLIDQLTEKFCEIYNCTSETASSMLYNGGYKIYATVDSDIQDTMESVYENTNKYFYQKYSKNKNLTVQSAMTILDYNGNIKGIVGGVGKKTVNRGLNRAIDSPRQPGSTMKPLGVYMQAIDNGSVTSSTAIEDKPIEKYNKDGSAGPREWYGYYDGYLTISEALERSANTIPCWVLQDYVGIENSFDFLTQKLHFKSLTKADKNISSLALGGCQYGITTTESAAAFAVFGNGGVYNEPTTYIKVLDSNGDTILQSQEGEQVIKPTTATIMNKMLQNVVYGSKGTGGRIAGYSNMKAYAKTGTSSEAKDLWMVAGTPYYVGSVWCGFDQPENVNIKGAAANVWRDIMSKIHKGLEYKEFEFSDEVLKRTYCRDSGLLAGSNCTDTALGYYVEGNIPKYCTGEHPVSTYQQKPADEEETETPSTPETPTENPPVTETPTTEAPSEEPSASQVESGDDTVSDTTSDTSSETSSSETASSESENISSDTQTETSSEESTTVSNSSAENTQQ